jgi:hypothetical protein
LVGVAVKVGTIVEQKEAGPDIETTALPPLAVTVRASEEVLQPPDV